MNKRIILSAKIIICVFIIWYLFHSGLLKPQHFVVLFSHKHIFWVLFAGILFLVSQGIAALRLKVLLKIIDFPSTYWDIFRLTMIGNLFNQTMPGIIGGDIVKGYYLFAEETEAKGQTTGILILDRVMGILALALICVFSLFYLIWQHSYDTSSFDQQIKFLQYIIIIFMVFALIIWLLSNINQSRAFFKQIIIKLFGDSFLFNTMSGMGILLKANKLLLTALLISLLIQIACILGVVSLVPTFCGKSQPIVVLISITAIVMFIGLIPLTPGNIGWTEFIAALAWMVVGSADGAKIFAYWRIICIMFTIPDGLLFLFIRQRTGSQRLKSNIIQQHLLNGRQ